MANVSRAARSASSWTAADLASYNIVLRHQNAAEFFGTQHLPRTRVSREILKFRDASEATVVRNQELLNRLDLAMSKHNPEESAVDDFTLNLFRVLGYDQGHRVARARKNIRLPICGELRHAKTDICLLDRRQTDKMLLVQENKRFKVAAGERDEAEV
jgi:hypothetical protein